MIGFVRLGRNGKPSPRWRNPWIGSVGVELSQIEELKHITSDNYPVGGTRVETATTSQGCRHRLTLPYAYTYIKGVRKLCRCKAF